MKRKEFEEKTFDFAIEAIKTFRSMSTEQKRFPLSRQFLRKATALGASVYGISEPQALSREEFLKDLTVALKRSRESECRIMLLMNCDSLCKETGNALLQKNKEITSLLRSFVKITRAKM